MKIDINNIDSRLLEEDARIVAYLKGQMSSEEEQQFMIELEGNSELKEKAIMTARLVRGLKEVGAEQDIDTMGAFLASSEQGAKAVAQKATQLEEATNVKEAQKGISFRKIATWLSIAASVVLIVWTAIDYSTYRKTTALAEQFGADFESSLITRDADAPSQSEKKLEALFRNVKNNENIEETIHELSLCWELSTMETYNDYTDYAAEIGWNLAIAYLKDNNKKEAKKVLEKLIVTTEEGSALNEKAKELQDKL